jgi:hypothetical protein
MGFQSGIDMKMPGASFAVSAEEAPLRCGAAEG